MLDHKLSFCIQALASPEVTASNLKPNVLCTFIYASQERVKQHNPCLTETHYTANKGCSYFYFLRQLQAFTHSVCEEVNTWDMKLA